MTPGDGPQEFHLVLLDNGRTDALADQVGRRRCAASAARPASTSARSTSAPAATPTARSTPARSAPILTPLLTGAGSTSRRARCRTPRRSAAPASRSARSASTSPRCWSHLRAKVVDAHRGDRRRKPEALAMQRRVVHVLRRAPARPGRARSPGSPAGSSAGSGVRRCPAAARGRPAARARRAWTAARDLPAPPRGVLPRLVAAYVGRTRRCRRWGRVVSARDEILARVRAALSDVPPQPETDVPPGSAARRRRRRTLVELFVERVADYRAVVDAVRRRRPRARWSPRCPAAARRVVVPPGLGLDVARRRSSTTACPPAELDGLDAVVTARARRHRRDRHDRARPPARPGPPGAQPGARPPRLRGPTPTRWCADVPERSPCSTLPAR